MLDSRAQRKHTNKLQKWAKQSEESHAIIEQCEAQLRAIAEAQDQVPTTEEPPQTRWYQPSMPAPPAWSKAKETENPTLALVNSITEKSLKQMVLDGSIDTAIADSGASSSCAKETTTREGEESSQKSTNTRCEEGC